MTITASTALQPHPRPARARQAVVAARTDAHGRRAGPNHNNNNSPRPERALAIDASKPMLPVPWLVVGVFAIVDLSSLPPSQTRLQPTMPHAPLTCILAPASSHMNPRT
ncbi:hypothetical protein P171DRAFT_428957 [Karstenula rhodostoma CBS 690.94]|uniref:Uncharacterized protein n=1 Tax=Karstenula rhodostoma CBS 690.94 TaxID=1392251 RepID=A0A9P4UGX4_9PLEO|nr:hypothetical protein P171DRAFT_428957 [Karstenula rhodostoma CBS 690.94]